MSSYRPTRSQQLIFELAIKQKFADIKDKDVVVHHVLKENYTEAVLQIEVRSRPIPPTQSVGLIKNITDPFGTFMSPKFYRVTI